MIDNNVVQKDKIAVVIPCYKCRNHILEVVSRIPYFVDAIYVVDDACPMKTGTLVKETIRNDSRIKVLFHEKNQGVGGAMLTGYQQALNDGMGIIAKIDGDGQMDPALLRLFCLPLIRRRADYAKGNRFISPRTFNEMPLIRILGNMALSFMAKVSTGYWQIFDPNNGYTAIRAEVLQLVELNQIHRRFFFESDMLFRLNLLGATVADIPMKSRYGDEQSNLSEIRAIPSFFGNHLKNMFKRVLYIYFAYNFNLASINFLLGFLFLSTGLIYGSYNWHFYASNNLSAPTGTIVISATLIISGIQLLLSFLGFDVTYGRSFVDFGTASERPTEKRVEAPRPENMVAP